MLLDSLKYVLKHRENKNLGRVASSAKVVLQKSSFPPIHLSIWTPQILRLKTRRTSVPYSKRFPTSFSFCSSSLNHSLSMHSVHFLPILELEKSKIVDIWGAEITTLHGSTYTSFLCLAGAQNSGLPFWPITHPTITPCNISSCPSVKCRRSAMRSTISHVLRPMSGP